MTKRIVLCADDYGQAPEISQGILALIKYGRLSAVSCMVNTPYWLEHAKWLLPVQPNVDIGLHFNLTHGKALSSAFIAKYGENLPPLPVLLRQALLRQLDKAALEAEFSAQIDRFKEGVGFQPAFIDGHQHVHQFPVIREAFASVYQQRFKKQQKPYVCHVNPRFDLADFFNNFKKLIIFISGAPGFGRLLEAQEIPTISSHTGMYSFAEAANYRALFIGFLKACDDGGLIMCHPGLKAAGNTSDPIADARYLEYQYLFGDKFLYDCHQQKVVLGRYY